MQTIGKLIGRSQYGPEPSSSELVTANRLGVEIELEGFESANYDAGSRLNYWELKEDNSLRNGGVEFVTHGGLGGESLIAAINEMDSFLSRVEFNASWRCSTHMHINMLDCTIEQCVKTILSYMCVESIMFDFCAEYRQHSNFCVPLTKSAWLTREMVAYLGLGRIGPHSPGNKYMALNIVPLGQGNLGTLEFRGSHALTTRSDLLGLANRLLSIKNFAINFPGSVDEMLYTIETGGWRQILSSGVHEGYVVDYERFEKCVMSAWSCHKRYQRLHQEHNDELNHPSYGGDSQEMNSRPMPTSTRDARLHRQGSTVDLNEWITSTAHTVDTRVEGQWAGAGANRYGSGAASECFASLIQYITDRYWEQAGGFHDVLRMIVALERSPQIVESGGGLGSRTVRQVLRSAAVLLVSQWAPSLDNSSDLISRITDATCQALALLNQTLPDDINVPRLTRAVLDVYTTGYNNLPSALEFVHMDSWHTIFPAHRGRSYWDIMFHLYAKRIKIKNRNTLRSIMGSVGPLPLEFRFVDLWAIMQTYRLNSRMYVFTSQYDEYRRLAGFLSYQYRASVPLLVQSRDSSYICLSENIINSVTPAVVSRNEYRATPEPINRCVMSAEVSSRFF